MSENKLAVRTLNEARRLDPLAYLSLRYTLDGKISQNNRWAREVAPIVVHRNSEPGFVKTRLFKQVDKNGKPEFRTVFMPGGPQLLAEAALIDACSRTGPAFKPGKGIYSYRFAKRYSADGIFTPYFELFSERQTAIGAACKRRPDDWVLYADIKKFYPSITSGRIATAWRDTCDNSGISTHWKAFGHELIERQFTLGEGLLIGPMFSHLLGNILLRDLDEKMRSAFPSRYFRYVDDFALVIPKEKKNESLKILRRELAGLGLRLNRNKIFFMKAATWKENAPFQMADYTDEPIGDHTWMRFIDNLKCYLMAHPEQRDDVAANFRDAELRIPIPRYEAATHEKTYGNRFLERLQSGFFVERVSGLTARALVAEGQQLRQRYLSEFEVLWPEYTTTEGLHRRWKLSRVRYLIGRLLLTGTMEQVGKLSRIIAPEPEVAEYSAMLSTLVNGDAEVLLPFGWKVAAAAAQPLAAAGIRLRCQPKRWQREALEAYTALCVAGVEVDAELSAHALKQHRIMAVHGGYDSGLWAKTKDPFYREFFALARGNSFAEHKQKIQTPLDPDEKWEVFADELLGLDPT